MNVLLRVTIPFATGLLLLGCGGDSSPSTSSSSKPRAGASEGYFDAQQSDDLNPLLADYDAAFNAYYDGDKACAAQSARRYEAGATPRESIACRFRLTGDYRDAVVALREGVEEVDGEFRAPCEEQVEAFTTFLGRFEDALDAEYADWEAYASGRPYPRLQQHVDAITKLAGTFRDEQVPAMSAACYTEADRKAAGKA